MCCCTVAVFLAGGLEVDVGVDRNFSALQERVREVEVCSDREEAG